MAGAVTKGRVDLTSRNVPDRCYQVTMVTDARASSRRAAQDDPVDRITDGAVIRGRTAAELMALSPLLRTIRGMSRRGQGNETGTNRNKHSTGRLPMTHRPASGAPLDAAIMPAVAAALPASSQSPAGIKLSDFSI